jgi:hypothetical protein
MQLSAGFLRSPFITGYTSAWKGLGRGFLLEKSVSADQKVKEGVTT